MTTKGMAIIWGVQAIKPIVNIPPGALKVRLRLRNNNAARAYVKFIDRVEHWVLTPVGPGMGGDWQLGIFQGVNYLGVDPGPVYKL